MRDTEYAFPLQAHIHALSLRSLPTHPDAQGLMISIDARSETKQDISSERDRTHGVTDQFIILLSPLTDFISSFHFLRCGERAGLGEQQQQDLSRRLDVLRSVWTQMSDIVSANYKVTTSLWRALYRSSVPFAYHHYSRYSYQCKLGPLFDTSRTLNVRISVLIPIPGLNHAPYNFRVDLYSTGRVGVERVTPHISVTGVRGMLIVIPPHTE